MKFQCTRLIFSIPAVALAALGSCGISTGDDVSSQVGKVDPAVVGEEYVDVPASLNIEWLPDECEFALPGSTGALDAHLIDTLANPSCDVSSPGVFESEKVPTVVIHNVDAEDRAALASQAYQRYEVPTSLSSSDGPFPGLSGSYLIVSTGRRHDEPTIFEASLWLDREGDDSVRLEDVTDTTEVLDSQASVWFTDRVIEQNTRFDMLKISSEAAQ